MLAKNDVTMKKNRFLQYKFCFTTFGNILALNWPNASESKAYADFEKSVIESMKKSDQGCRTIDEELSQLAHSSPPPEIGKLNYPPVAN